MPEPVQENTPSIFCADCNSPMHLKRNHKGLLYGCSRYPLCHGMIMAHEDGRPQGTPADQKTRTLRHKTHDAFDRYWKLGQLTREQSYQLLMKAMRMDRDDCHIGKFTDGQCEYVLSMIDSGAFDLMLQEYKLELPRFQPRQ